MNGIAARTLNAQLREARARHPRADWLVALDHAVNRLDDSAWEATRRQHRAAMNLLGYVVTPGKSPYMERMTKDAWPLLEALAKDLNLAA